MQQPVELTYEIALNTLDNLASQASLDRRGHFEVQQCILKLKELVNAEKAKTTEIKENDKTV